MIHLHLNLKEGFALLRVVWKYLDPEAPEPREEDWALVDGIKSRLTKALYVAPPDSPEGDGSPNVEGS